MTTGQTEKLLTNTTRFKGLHKNELKCSEAVITGLNIYQGINELKEFKWMEETGWSTVTKQLISRPDKVDGTSSNKT